MATPIDAFQSWRGELEAVEQEMDRLIAAGLPASVEERQVRQTRFLALVERREAAARKLLQTDRAGGRGNRASSRPEAHPISTAQGSAEAPLTRAMWKPILTVAINLTFLPLLFRLTSFRLPLMLQLSLPSLQRCCPLALPLILPLAPLMSLHSLLTPQAYLPVLLLPRLWMLALPLALANYLLTWLLILRLPSQFQRLTSRLPRSMPRLTICLRYLMLLKLPRSLARVHYLRLPRVPLSLRIPSTLLAMSSQHLLTMTPR